MKDKLVQIKDAAEMLGVSKLTLRNWDKAGKLKAYRHPINNYRVYKSEDLERILNQTEYIPQPPKLSTGGKSSQVKNDTKSETYTLKVLHLRD